MQELKSSGGVLYSVQPTLPEAGGQMGVVLDGRVSGVAPWGSLRWLLLLRGPTHENSCGLAGHRPSGCVSNALQWKLARYVRATNTYCMYVCMHVSVSYTHLTLPTILLV